ncbi:right-handed parallel beta-helix repeat-containing protein [Cohnella endophytica]|nr:right-handed parallel beta-helix repeat-containing protein [Cohnella endophytica]
MLQAISFYVSPQGNDDNHGNERSPFLTIERAQRAVRESIASGMSADANVYLGGGYYEVGSTIMFDERDSGRDGFRVRYRNVTGEKPILVGGELITGWERHDDSIWKAKLLPGRRFQTLYADGRRVRKARLPARGYFNTDESAPESSKEGIRYFAADLHDELCLEDAQVFTWPGEGEWNWFSETKSVREVDRQSRMLLFETPATWGIGHGSRYYLQGSLAFLQAPGQFHLDEPGGIVYYWPEQDEKESGDPNRQTIAAPMVTRLIELSGRDNDRRLRNFELSGLTLVCTDGFRDYGIMDGNSERAEHREALIYLNRVENISIKGCTISQSGSSGIFLDRYARQVTIDRNTIAHVGYVGVYASGYAPGEGDFKTADDSYTNKGHTITNNRITCGGELIGHGCGIMLYQSGDNGISHNEISHMPRYGISLKGLRFGTMPESLYGIPVTWDNHYDFLHSKNNRIAYNEIFNVMTDSQDGGMIEAWGPGKGNVIHGNHLHHSGIHFSFGFGIYLDDASDDFTVTSNVLNDLYSTGQGKLWMLIFSKGIGNRIYNNLLANNPRAISAFGTQEMVGEANRDVDIASNLVYDSGQYVYYFVNWDKTRFKAADGNLYWRNGAACLVAGEIAQLKPRGPDRLERNEYDWEEWRSLVNGKYDGNTIIADPLFLDEEARDYRLRPDSPAYRIGWQEIEFDRIGPRKD